MTPGRWWTPSRDHGDRPHRDPTATRSSGGVVQGHEYYRRPWPWAGCLIARQALEQVVDLMLETHQLACPNAPMRARLICLGQAYPEGSDIPYRASTLWAQLSSACHHHAYELDPSVGAAVAMIDHVGWLLNQLDVEQAEPEEHHE